VVIAFSAREEHVGKLEVCQFTLALISWALYEGHSETPGGGNFTNPLLLLVSFLYVLASNLVLNVIQGPIRHRMALLTGRPFVVPHDVVILLKHCWHTSQDTSSKHEVPLLTQDQMVTSAPRSALCNPKRWTNSLLAVGSSGCSTMPTRT
jgi:hypothetical protein